MINVCHAYIFYSIKFAGGTCDLIKKLISAQTKINIKTCVLTGDYKIDYELVRKSKETKFIIEKSFFDKEGLSIMPNLLFNINQKFEGINIVHMHVFRTYQNLFLYYFCKFKKIPYIIDAHGAVPYGNRKRFLKKLFDHIWGRKMLSNASFLIAETKVGVNEYLICNKKINNKKIKIISPPFDTEEFKILPEIGSFRNKFHIPKQKKIITFLGRIHYIKGIDFLIRGFNHLLGKRDDVILCIVGSDDGFKDQCDKLISDLSIKKEVLFTGFLSGNEKNQALIDSDIVAQTSRQEQGAWAPFEAVLCKTPIVVTKETGAGEDVQRINAGEVITFGDTEGLSTLLNKMLDNYNFYKQKTEVAKEYIENNLSMDKRSNEYKELYLEAIRNYKNES